MLIRQLKMHFFSQDSFSGHTAKLKTKVESATQTAPALQVTQQPRFLRQGGSQGAISTPAAGRSFLPAQRPDALALGSGLVVTLPPRKPSG